MSKQTGWRWKVRASSGSTLLGLILLIDDGGYKICEANSSPIFFEGMKSCCDIDVANEILDFLSLRMGRVFGHGPVPLGAEVKAVGDMTT